MRAVLLVGAIALCVAGKASAKLGTSLELSTRHPQRGEAVVAVLRTEERVDAGCRMRLIAVAPGADVSTAIEAFVAGGVSVQGPGGYGFHRIAPTRRLGFEPRLARIGPRRWRGVVRFPRSGRWRLVVPNECAPGWMYPFPVSRSVTVR